MYKGTYTLLARLVEIKYEPVKKNPIGKKVRGRTIQFKDRWELIWDPIKKVLYGIKKSNLDKYKSLLKGGLINHPSYKMVKVFKDQDVSGAFEVELEKNADYEKLGKAVHVVYNSDKWNKGTHYDYIHEFGEDGYVVNKNHGVNLYYDPMNKVYKMSGGKLNVDERGIIF